MKLPLKTVYFPSLSARQAADRVARRWAASRADVDPRRSFSAFVRWLIERHAAEHAPDKT